MKHYYKVTEGPTFDILQVIILQLLAARDAQMAWKVKHALPVKHISYGAVWFEDGFTPDKRIWKKGAKGSFHPRGSRPEGTALAKELEKLPKPPGWSEVLFAFIGERKDKDFMMVNSKGAISFIKVKEPQAFYMQSDPYWLPEDQTGLVEVTAAECEANVKP